MSFDTPILLIVFNRPGQTRKVFERIKEIKPRQFFVAADGPRDNNNEDILACQTTRKIIEEVDWKCDVKILFRESNLGCKDAPAQAIDWFFAHVEKGIILEDDCLPSPSFFNFCDQLLVYYQSNTTVMMISGFNPLGNWNSSDIDYFFSDGTTWGWATWRRAWQKYDLYVKDYLAYQTNTYYVELIESHFAGINVALREVIAGRLDAWDYQWLLARLVNHGLSVTPSVNLIENIGFGTDATHTKYEFSPYNHLKTGTLSFPLRLNDILINDGLFKSKVLELEDKKISSTERLKNRLRKLAFWKK